MATVTCLRVTPSSSHHFRQTRETELRSRWSWMYGTTQLNTVSVNSVESGCNRVDLRSSSMRLNLKP
ncbi:hypothetical protein Hanom_Chr14g01270491 [Helianthus anomalus]